MLSLASSKINLSFSRSLTSESFDSAQIEMKLITAAIYSNFTTTIVDDEGIEATDAYTVQPKSNKLILRFEPV